MDRKNLLGRCCFTIALIVATYFFSAHAAFGQLASETGLVLKAGRGSSMGQCRVIDSTSTCERYRMIFENQGRDPVIIINPTLSFGTGIKEIIYYFGDETVFAPAVKISSQTDNLRSVAALFDDEKPPENLTIVLKPGATFTFEEIFEAKVDRELFHRVREERYTDPISGKVMNRRVMQHGPYNARLVYEYSFLQIVEDPDFLDKLSIRWRRYGKMPIGPNGTYTITSQPIR